MLNVHCRVNIDAVVKKFLNILVAFKVTASRRVGVREFIDKDQLWFSCEDGVEVHFFHDVIAVLNFFARYNGKVCDKSLSLGSLVGFNNADDNIDPF